jgi:hypothetical protein
MVKLNFYVVFTTHYTKLLPLILPYYQSKYTAKDEPRTIKIIVLIVKDPSDQ